MGMVVRTNTMAQNAYRQLGVNNTAVGKSLEKLSSGFRINRAADDASGLAISEKMKAQIKGLEQASANSQDGISLIQTAEGATTEIHNMLNRMTELATKSANGTIQDKVDREAIQKEVNDLKDEITRISKSTNFNGINLLDGSLGSGAVSVAGASTLKAGATLDTGAITSLTGFSLADGSTATLSSGTLKADGTIDNATPGPDLQVSIKDKAGNVTITNLKLTDIITKADGTTAAAGDAVAIGGKINIDLSSVGIGKLEVAVSETASTVQDIFDDLHGKAITAEIVAGAAAAGSGLTLQVGDTNATYNHVTVAVDNLSASGLGIDGTKVDVSSQVNAGKSIDVIKQAINKVSTNRANLGSLQNRLEYTINNLDTTAENMTAANSRIRDTDMAKEMMNYTKMNILTQSAQAMLAQANQQPQAILQLLQ